MTITSERFRSVFQSGFSLLNYTELLHGVFGAQHLVSRLQGKDEIPVPGE